MSTTVTVTVTAAPSSKSKIVFDINVYSPDTDLHALFNKITTSIIMDGLAWIDGPQIIPVGYGLKKLRVGCVIEDDKVSVDGISERVQACQEEVQAVDVVMFMKV